MCFHQKHCYHYIDHCSSLICATVILSGIIHTLPILKNYLYYKKKAIRAISWSKQISPTNPLFYRYGLLKLPEYNLYQNACVMDQVVHRSNTHLCELIPLYSSSHRQNTRNKLLLKGKYRKLKCTRFSIGFRGPQIWNELENNIKHFTTFSIFKRNVKYCLLGSYASDGFEA